MREVWDELEWTPDLPAGKNDLFPRLEAAPAPGDRCWLRIYRDFDGSEVFHALFQPALSSLNGWTIHPRELLDSAVVECRKLGDRKGWLNVEVLSVTPLAELAQPHEEPFAELDWLTQVSPRVRCQAAPLHYFEAAFESESGAWAVAREEAAGQLSIILWNRVERGGPALAGHLPLTADQQRELLAFPLENLD